MERWWSPHPWCCSSRTNMTTPFGTHVPTARPFSYGTGTNVVENGTTQTDSPGASSKLAFHFAVM